MCVSAFKAEFTGTKLYLGKKKHPLYGNIFVLGYQNNVQNLHTGPNAMLIHLPTKQLDKMNLLDMSSNKTIFSDFQKSIEPQAKSISMGFAGPVSRESFSVVKHGVYDVIMADSAKSIPEAMKFVDPLKRVYINQELIDFYSQHYTDYMITLWCFNNRDMLNADPVFIWYKSIHEDFFVLPAVDAHTGHAPDLSKIVQTDHYVFLGSDQNFDPNTWHEAYYDFYTDKKLKFFLPEFVTGQKFKKSMINGDFVAPFHTIATHGTEALTRYVPAALI